MASEARRAARALVATHSQSFPSRFSRAESLARLTAALGAIETDSAQRAAVRGTVAADRVALAFGRPRTHRSQCTFVGAWVTDGDAVRLDGAFLPVGRTRRFLASTSVILSILILGSLWLIFAPDQDSSMKVLVPVITVLSILAFPFVVVAMASHREVEELAISKVVRKALSGEEEADRSRAAPSL